MLKSNKIKLTFGTIFFVFAICGRVFDGAKMAIMIMNYDESTIQPIIGASLSVLYNASLAIGIGLICVVITPWIWEKYQGWKNKLLKLLDK